MFSTLKKDDVSVVIMLFRLWEINLTSVQHSRRRRALADRYANTNILKSGSLDGIKERSMRFIERCSKSIGGSVDIFVSKGYT